ncbi:MAG: SpoIIE family protein phosphatase [Prevotella sp.]|nr:SpoIIE family protein phosphatase [Prevotella sp.]
MHSFSSRLTRRIVLALTMALALVIVGVVYQASAGMKMMVRGYCWNVANITNESVEKRLRDIEATLRNCVDDLGYELDNPENVVTELQDMLQRNPSLILDFGAGFVADYYPEKGRWYEPFVIKQGGKIVAKQIGSEAHDYFAMEWYIKGFENDNGYWSEPYLDSCGTEMPICTYSLPIRDTRGQKVGTLGSDILLEKIHDYLKKKDLKANTEGPIKVSQKDEGNPRRWLRTMIVSGNGYYISHPDKQRTLHGNFYHDVSQQSDTIAARMISDMKAGIKGDAQVNIDGIDATIFYTPLENTNWSLVVVLPEERLMAVLLHFSVDLLMILLLGLAAVYVICRITIRRATRPLHFLAKSADEVAKGNFNAPLPDIRHDDEIHKLRDSFSNMQHSLSLYMDELKTTTAQKSAMESELSIAHNIQMAMLPNLFPAFPERTDIDLYASLVPARDVGGDLYDYFLRDDRLYFCIGDVSGKSVPAALMMAVIRAMFRSETRRATTAASIIDVMNHNMSEEYTAGYFVTMFVGVLDLKTGHLDYCNAGHEAPVVAGERLKVIRNLPIGALADWTYEGQQMQLQPGDMLFLYTDGLTEANNPKHQMFGRERVLQIVREHKDDTPQQLLELMDGEVRRHAADAEQSDDVTMLAIRWEPKHTLSLRASMEDIGKTDPFLEQVSRALSSKEAKRLRLAVEEAVANIINHGEATQITLQAAETTDALTITIEDDGQPFDPTQGSTTDFSVTPDERPAGGLGIMLLHQMTEGMSYERRQEHNVLTLMKRKQ